jgi:hypothetical protein
MSDEKPRKGRWGPGGCALLAGFTVLGTLIGYFAGAYYFCQPGAGNDCGLIAVFFTAPIGAIVGLVAYVMFRLR